jgi:hypothetical protein
VAALSPTTIQNLIQVYGFLFPMAMLECMAGFVGIRTR